VLLPAIITFFCVHAVADDNRRAEKGITPIGRIELAVDVLEVKFFRKRFS